MMADPVDFPSTTRNLTLPLLFSGQAQKEFFINHALSLIDAILAGVVVDTTDTPPTNPSEGSCFRVDGPANEDWAGHEGDIAIWLGSSWHFVAPYDGMNFFDQTATSLVHYNSGWSAALAPSEPVGGITVDAEARTAISELIEELRKIGIFPASA